MVLFSTEGERATRTSEAARCNKLLAANLNFYNTPIVLICASYAIIVAAMLWR